MTETVNTIDIKFFALIREQIGLDAMQQPYIANETMAELKQRLINLGEPYAFALSAPIVMACNQTIVDEDHNIQPADELAFFPPVTGG